MSVWPDEELLRRFREKDPEALSQVVREHAADLYRASLGFGLAPCDAEELVQASFVTFLGACQRFEGRSSVKTFLFGILYKKALEQGRKRSKELATDPADEVFDGRFRTGGHWSQTPKGPDEEAALNETSRLIGECLDGLSDQQRAAFQLKEVDGQSNADICNVLDLNDTHLRVLLFRARNKLRECLERKWK